MYYYETTLLHYMKNIKSLRLERNLREIDVWAYPSHEPYAKDLVQALEENTEADTWAEGIYL